jgi:hypothetical protein
MGLFVMGEMRTCLVVKAGYKPEGRGFETLYYYRLQNKLGYIKKLSNPHLFRTLRKLPPSDLPYRFTETTQILTTVFKCYF